MAKEKSLIQKLETNLQHREEALRQKQAGAKGGPESGDRVGWEARGTFPGPYPCIENRQQMADRDPPIRGGNHPQGKIHSKQRAIGDPQLEGLGMWEPFRNNLHQREWGRTPSQGESEIPDKPPGLLGSSSLPGLDQSPRKGGGARQGKGATQVARGTRQVPSIAESQSSPTLSPDPGTIQRKARHKGSLGEAGQRPIQSDTVEG